LTNFSLEIFITRLLFAHTRLSKSFSCAVRAQDRTATWLTPAHRAGIPCPP